MNKESNPAITHTYCSTIMCSNYLPCQYHFFARDDPTKTVMELLHAAAISDSTIHELRNETHQDHLALFERLQTILDAIAQECPSKAKERCQMFVQRIIPTFVSLHLYQDPFCRALNGMLLHAAGHMWPICKTLCQIDWKFANTIVAKHPELELSHAFGIFVIHCCLAPISRDESLSNLALAMKHNNNNTFDVVLIDKLDDNKTLFMRTTWVNNFANVQVYFLCVC